jgi:hypothetical protein
MTENQPDQNLPEVERELPEIDPAKLETYVGESPEQAPVQPPPNEEPPPMVDQSVALVEDGMVVEQAKSKIKLDTGSLGIQGRAEFRRALNITGMGATRCRLFYAKIAPAPMEYMQKSINDWLDQEEVEVKFVSQVVGVLEGKRSEPNIIVTIWY